MTRLKLLTSTRVTLVLLLAFAGAMAVATFIENDHGTPVARGLVYEAWWFELIMLWLAINFLAHMGQYKLFHKNRWPIGLFHIAFVLIIVGAGVTRYFSEEGTIHIREGQQENTFFTTARYLQVKQLGEQGGKRFEKPVSLISHNFKPVTTSVQFSEPDFKVTFQEYIVGAREEIEKGDKTYFDMAVAMGEGRQDYMVEQGHTVQLGTTSLGTQRDAKNPIRIFKNDTAWVIQSDVHLQQMEMATQQIGAVHAGETKPLKMRSLYQWEGGAFLIKAIPIVSKV